MTQAGVPTPSLPIQNGEVCPVVTWAIVQQADETQQYSVADQINRSRPTAIWVDSSPGRLSGELVFSMWDAQGKNVMALPVEPGRYVPVTVGNLAAGLYKGDVRYIKGDRAWVMGKRDIPVGTVQVAIGSLAVCKENEQEVTLTGLIQVECDGPFSDLSIALFGELIQHRFTFNPHRCEGAMESSTIKSVPLLAPATIQNESSIVCNIQLRTQLAIPDLMDADTFWELQMHPQVQPAHALVTETSAKAWLGGPTKATGWRGFLQHEKETHTQLAPGIEVIHITGNLPEGPLSLYLVVADLVQPGLSINAMVGHSVTELGARWPRSVVSDMVTETRATLGVNANYFAILDTMCPIGMIIRSGELLSTGSREAFAFDKHGKPYLGLWQWEGRLMHPDGTGHLPVKGLNEKTPGETVSISRWPATRSPGSIPGTTDEDLHRVELVVVGVQDSHEIAGSTKSEDYYTITGVVSAIRKGEPGVALSPDMLVIGASSQLGEHLLHTYKVGDRVEILYRLNGAAEWPHLDNWQDIQAAICGGVVLLRNGLYASKRIDTDLSQSPRTAIAVSANQSRLYIMVADGRSADSVGMTYRQEADFFRYIGAFHAVNLDGGGSATLVVKDPVDGSTVVLNAPCDGAERPVSNGLGLYYHDLK